VALVRLARAAQEDLARILATSAARWGDDARDRYAGLIAAAIGAIATDPEGPMTRDRSSVVRGVRSLHLRHVPGDHDVGRPVHVVYYRIAGPDVVEVVRVLHGRMEPTRHVAGKPRRRPGGRGK
jgi:toxin ParE1/3/4